MIFNKENKFILVKIFKSYLNDFDIYDKDNIIDLFKDIFITIKNKYNLLGLFDVDIYVNDEYGLIIEIHNICSYDYEIDLRINVHLDSIFFSEINSSEILDYNKVYYYNDKFYGLFKKFSDNDVIYKNTNVIINDGIKVC